MLEISHVTKKYRDKEALSDVSLTIPQGQIVGLLGENGATICPCGMVSDKMCIRDRDVLAWGCWGRTVPERPR